MKLYAGPTRRVPHATPSEIRTMPFTLLTTMMKTLTHPARNAGISLAVVLGAMTAPLQAEKAGTPSSKIW